jgi:hypothetical protein
LKKSLDIDSIVFLDILPGNGARKILAGALLMWELLLLQSSATASEKIA